MTGTNPTEQRLGFVNDLRVMVFGGLFSYRALFAWLTPWILIPTFLVNPIFQILFFANVGQDAGVGNAKFFVLGNAVQYAAIPCLFGMSNSVGGERHSATLGLLMSSPARRIPLFLGRMLPVVVNGFGVSVVGLVVGALLLRIEIPASTWPLLVLSIAVSAVSCTGLGLILGALALRVRESAVLPNILYGVLMFASGANTPLSALPGWLDRLGRSMPLSHGILATRAAADGATMAEISSDLLTELGIGAVYVVIGLLLLHHYENASRRHATLDIA